MNITFNGKTAVVTGGTGGIGSAIAKTLLESGAQVALIDVSVEKLREMEKQLSAYGTVKSYPLNVTDTSAIPDCREPVGAAVPSGGTHLSDVPAWICPRHGFRAG